MNDPISPSGHIHPSMMMTNGGTRGIVHNSTPARLSRRERRCAPCCAPDVYLSRSEPRPTEMILRLDPPPRVTSHPAPFARAAQKAIARNALEPLLRRGEDIRMQKLGHVVVFPLLEDLKAYWTASQRPFSAASMKP